MSNFFGKEASVHYDEKNLKLAPVSDNMHFLIRLVLQDLPTQARILCVGVGTGAEILWLSKAFPHWTFVGVDPSESMLDVCRERLKGAGVLDRCELVHGYVQDLPAGEKFDAGLSILVAHFIQHKDRLGFFQNICQRVRPGGYLINTEISCDLNSPEFPFMLKNWEKVQGLMGATPESLASLPTTLREILTVLPPAETEKLLMQSGVSTPVRFFQSFMIHGWWGKKS